MSWLDELREDPDRALQRARERLLGMRRIALSFATVWKRSDDTLVAIVSTDSDIVAVPRWNEWGEVKRVRFLFPDSTTEIELPCCVRLIVRPSGVAVFWLREKGGSDGDPSRATFRECGDDDACHYLP